jgi:hypothetical protein
MSTGKVKWDTRENLLISAYAGIAFIFLADFLLPDLLIGVRVFAGLYLFFYPLGALALKALKIAPENPMEKLMLSAFTSFSLIALIQLSLQLAFNMPFTLYTLLIIIAVSSLAFYILAGWKRK